MTSSPSPLNADQLRNGYLSRMYVARSALQWMLIRMKSCRDIPKQEVRPVPELRVFQTVETLYRLHTLVENLLQVYELMAEKIDIRYDGQRKGLQGRIYERHDRGLARFQRKIWVYTLFKHITDSAFARRGLNPETARAILEQLATRSIARLDVADEMLRRFHTKYEPFCVAHKHGRAVFGIEVRANAIPPGIGTVNFRATTSVATVIRADSSGAAECLSLIVDEELASEMDEAYATVENQLPRLNAMLSAITAAAEQTLDYVEGRRSESHLETQSFHFFDEPYSVEEVEVLLALGDGGPLEFE